MTNIFRYSFVGFKLPRIYSDIHLIKKNYSVNEYYVKKNIMTQNLDSFLFNHEIQYYKIKNKKGDSFHSSD
jgi:hypothetical protein